MNKCTNTYVQSATATVKASVHLLYRRLSQDEDVTNSDHSISVRVYQYRLVVADDQCTQYQFTAPYYPGISCEDTYNMNPESRDKSGYYWIFDDVAQVMFIVYWTPSDISGPLLL